MLWFEESVKITPELANSLRMLLALPTVGMYFSLGILLLGLFILLFVVMLKVVVRPQWDLVRSWNG
jgi:hypothetical protein